VLGGKIHKEALSRSIYFRQMLTASEQVLPTQSKCIDGADVHPRKVLRALCFGVASQFRDGTRRAAPWAMHGCDKASRRFSQQPGLQMASHEADTLLGPHTVLTVPGV